VDQKGLSGRFAVRFEHVDGLDGIGEAAFAIAHLDQVGRFNYHVGKELTVAADHFA